ncbi:MAG TPA: hypothetical protein VFX55_16195 [Duganella sp.]|nr:hypothetical protein [Duganella sp.]
MGINYTLQNFDVDAATVVVVKNLMLQPSAGNEGDACAPAGSGPRFVYTPWQFLNPSQRAEESFRYENAIYVGLRRHDSPESERPRLYPVFVGRSYVLVIGVHDISLQELQEKKGGESYVEIYAPSAMVDPVPVDIDWYLGGLVVAEAHRVGITRHVCSGQRALFQPDDGVLLFLAVPPNHISYRTYEPEEFSLATPYKAPSNVTEVKVTLEYDDSGLAVYAFSHRNALGNG